MAEVLFYHHALGLTDGFKALAQRLRDTGHTVHTPDLFDGRVFATIDEGVRYAQQAGFEAVLEGGCSRLTTSPQSWSMQGFRSA